MIEIKKIKIQLLKGEIWTVFFNIYKKILEKNNFSQIFIFFMFIQGNFISETISTIA